jgi:hypothetical protein
MRIHLVTVTPFALVILSSCGGQQAGGNPLPSSSSTSGATAPSVPDPLKELKRQLEEPQWQVIKSPLKDTVQIPQTGAYTYTPDQALGTLWALKAASGATSCKEAVKDTKLLEVVSLGRFMDSDPGKCKVRIGDERTVYTFRATEEALASLDIGSYLNTSASGKRAFEVKVSHPTFVSFEKERDCIPMGAIRKLRIKKSMNYCSVRWAKSAMLTTITSRAFSEIEADLKGAYVIVKVAGKLYSSSEELKETPILSGNYIDLQADLDFDETTGSVYIDTPAKGPSTPPSPTEPVVPKWPTDQPKSDVPVAVVKPDSPVLVDVKRDSGFKPPSEEK